MTAIAPPRRPANQPMPPPPSKVQSGVGLPLLPIAEVTLAIVSVVTVVGLRRVFVGTEWLVPVTLQVALAHGSLSLLRRRNVPLAPATLGVLVFALLVITWIYAGETTTFGIPTSASFDALGTALADARAAFPDVKAPTEALDGFLIASSAAVWVGAAIADWAAFRVDATIEATLPAMTLFVLGAVLGADIDRVLLSGLWIVAVLAFVLVRRAERLGRTATWVGDHRSSGPRALVVLGGVLALVAVAVAAVLGPRLPGARSEAIVSLTDIGSGGPGSRVTISPLVDIRSRLVDQAEVEVFTVRSDVRAYWRLTSLDRFDGRIWSSNGSYGKTSRELDEGVPVAAERLSFEQTFSIRALAQIWLPAAYEPQEVSVVEDVRYDEVSGTIIVDTDVPTSDNTDYRVLSALPQFDPAALSNASPAIPAEIAERYLDLPAEFPGTVRQLAQELTAGSGSAYEASLRLQNFFRDNFAYDLDVGAGHSDQAIEQFVFDLRRGYCEQFAGSFAAMARSVGIPARVAVGFTPGNSEPADTTLYRVRGEHAHAWPEVFLGEYGWVAFEPTPGRGAPFAERYTGVPEQQVQSGGDPTTATTTVSPPSTDASASTTTTPRDPDDPIEDLEVDPTADPTPANPWFTRIAVTAGVIVGAIALYLLTVLAVTGLRRTRRRRAAVAAEAKVALAWDETLATIRRAGLPVRGAETQSEVAKRVTKRFPDLETPLARLAAAVQDATYAPEPVAPEVGDEALVLADEIRLATAATMTAGDRFVANFHPSRLLDR